MADEPTGNKTTDDVDELLAQADSDNPDVAASAAERLEGLSPASAVPELLGALSRTLSRSSERVRSIVSDQIGKVPEVATPIARDMLRSAEATARATGAWALGFVGNPMTLPALLEALKDPIAEVRARATEALAAFEDDETALAKLYEALEDESGSVRAAAAKALGYVGGPDAVPVLINVIKDAEAVVREWAAFALGLIADTRAKGVLREACEDEDETVREAAEEALQRMEHSAY